jgi:Acetyltransferase (GNAT) domain
MCVVRNKADQAQTALPRIADSGYLHPDYANAMAAIGTPLFMPKSEGWVLKRPVPGFPYVDAVGCYPFYVCRNWKLLGEDLDNLKERTICLSLVTDPFGNYEPDELKNLFQTVVYPYKQHYMVDLGDSPRSFVSNHHRRYAKKALEALEVKICDCPAEYLDDWTRLYSVLIERHHIKGITAFSKESFTRQLKVPGIVAFQAGYGNEIVGMLLWYVQGDLGYYHLGAYSRTGYELRASFALFWTAIEYFASQGIRRLSLGAGAGVKQNDNDGLSSFKKGWSTSTRTVYFCGHINDRVKYDEIVNSKHYAKNDYFPAYRVGEFQ